MSNATSGRFFGEPSQVLLFLDWDNTLFPTTDLFERWGLSDNPADWRSLRLTLEQERVLESWRSALHDFLTTACALSERCVIVTNALRPWVHHCLERFAPNLQPLFAKQQGGPRVVYAREFHQDRDGFGPIPPLQKETLTAWKYSAMQKEAREFYQRYPGQTWKNVLSLGDMCYERDAVLDLGSRRVGPSRERLRVKTVKVPGPAVTSALALELRKWQVLMMPFVRYDGDIDVDLHSVQDRVQVIATAFCLPGLLAAPAAYQHLWNRNVGKKCPALGEDELVEQALDELAFIVRDATSG